MFAICPYCSKVSRRLDSPVLNERLLDGYRSISIRGNSDKGYCSHRGFVPDHQFGRHVVEGEDNDMRDKKYQEAGKVDIHLDHIS